MIGVSGGVDSVVLAHILASRDDYELILVFIDHGWRDVSQDLKMVRELASQFSLPVHEKYLKLKTKSEAEARAARYKVLHEAQEELGAQAVLVAHHADDQVETVILQLLRGAGRTGLNGLKSEGELLRPLLPVAKKDIMTYAKQHQLSWAEDPTNDDMHYRRNWVRNELIPRKRMKSKRFENEVLEVIERAVELNARINTELKQMTNITPDKAQWNRLDMRRQSIDVVQELIVYGCRQLNPEVELSARTIEQLAVDIKSGRFLRPRQLTKQLFVQVTHDKVAIAFKAQ